MPHPKHLRGTSITLVPRLLLLVLVASGCSRPLATGIDTSDSAYRADLQATVHPPEGWQAQPPDRGNSHVTQVWVSPSGDTALGVIRFTLPLPVGHEWALWGFLQNMRKSEGKAELVEKRWDDSIKAMRFVAEGGRYRVRSILYVDGLSGWSVFAGTLTDRPVNAAELLRAESARDQCMVGQ